MNAHPSLRHPSQERKRERREAEGRTGERGREGKKRKVSLKTEHHSESEDQLCFYPIE